MYVCVCMYVCMYVCVDPLTIALTSQTQFLHMLCLITVIISIYEMTVSKSVSLLK